MPTPGAFVAFVSGNSVLFVVGGKPVAFEVGRKLVTFAIFRNTEVFANSRIQSKVEFASQSAGSSYLAGTRRRSLAVGVNVWAVPIDASMRRSLKDCKRSEF